MGWPGAARDDRCRVPPLAVGQAPGQIPDVLTSDDEALFREFLQSRGHAAPETRSAAHPVLTAVRGQQRSQPGCDIDRPSRVIVPLDGAAVRSLHPLAARRDISDRQKKPAPKNSQPAPRGSHGRPRCRLRHRNCDARERAAVVVRRVSASDLHLHTAHGLRRFARNDVSGT